MTRIIKVLKNRTEYRDDSAIVHVQLEHGGESTVRVGGEVIEIFHAGQSKSYVRYPWERKNQSRKPKENNA